MGEGWFSAQVEPFTRLFWPQYTFLYIFVTPDSVDTIALTTRYVLIGDGGRMDIGGPEDECRLGGGGRHQPKKCLSLYLGEENDWHMGCIYNFWLIKSHFIFFMNHYFSILLQIWGRGWHYPDRHARGRPRHWKLRPEVHRSGRRGTPSGRVFLVFGIKVAKSKRIYRDELKGLYV